MGINRFPDAIYLCHCFHFDQLGQHILKWHSNKFARFWCSKKFCKLDPILHDLCHDTVASSLTVDNCVDFAYEIDTLEGSLSSSLLFQESAIELSKRLHQPVFHFIAQHFSLLSSKRRIQNLFEDLGGNNHLLNSILDQVANDVNESNIGDQIVTLQNLKEEGKDAHWNMESLDLLDSTQAKLTQKLSNLYLQVLHSPQWDVIPEAVKTDVTKSTFLFDRECKPANKPTLSSSKMKRPSTSKNLKSKRFPASVKESTNK